MLIITMLEVPANIINHVVTYGLLGGADTGNTLTVILFATYFAIACAWRMKQRRTRRQPTTHDVEAAATPCFESTRITVEAMEFLSALSTILVFCLYPSLAAYWGGDPTADPVLAQRGAVNTYLALIGSLLTGYYLHGLLGAAKTKASLVEAVRGASIAGGIAIGIVCNAKLSPDLSLLVGSFAACASVASRMFLDPFLEQHFGVDVDPMSSNSTFGIPALLGGFVSIVTAVVYSASSTDVKGLWDTDIGKIVTAQIVSVFLAPTLGFASGFVAGCVVPAQFLLAPAPVGAAGSAMSDVGDGEPSSLDAVPTSPAPLVGAEVRLP